MTNVKYPQISKVTEIIIFLIAFKLQSYIIKVIKNISSQEGAVITWITFILGGEWVPVFFHKELLGNFKIKRKIFSPHLGQNTGFDDDRDPREVDPKMKNPQLGRLSGLP